MAKGSIDQLLETLKKRRFEVSYYETPEEARDGILEKIKPGATVGIGGSMTVQQLNLLEELKQRGHSVYWHWLVPMEERHETCRKAGQTNYYLCSANAVTENGQIVNIDGGGNRVSAMVFGPEKVFIIIGKNKIVGNVEDALERIKTLAAPLNARRLGLKTPCAEKDKCGDCKLMCSVTTIIEARPHLTGMEIVIVNAELGF